MLENNVIRLHVVAESNDSKDQNIKLAVRDALLEHLMVADFADLEDKGQAKRYLENNTVELELLANDVLQSMGYDKRARVSFQNEYFDTRHYDTFSLPSGVYDSLRVEIGSGGGENWWCVVFPALCAPASTQGFCDVAASAGFDKGLTETLSNDEGYEIRFFLLDLIGRFENVFIAK